MFYLISSFNKVLLPSNFFLSDQSVYVLPTQHIQEYSYAIVTFYIITIMSLYVNAF